MGYPQCVIPKCDSTHAVHSQISSFFSHKFSFKVYLLSAWKVSKYEIFAAPYFPVFGPEKTPYLDNFHAVSKFKEI